MSEIKYNRRTWLNCELSHFTGSIVCFDGTDVINQGKHLDRYTFVEIGSCHDKVRIHADANLKIDEFIDKLELMRLELDLFINHLSKKSIQTEDDSIQAIYIKGLSKSDLWYKKHLKCLIPYCGIYPNEGYKSREEDGLTNIVYYQDAILVKIPKVYLTLEEVKYLL